MGYDWKRHRDEITRLALSRNLTLAQIRKKIAAKDPSFTPRSSTWRTKLKEWNLLRFAPYRNKSNFRSNFLTTITSTTPYSIPTPISQDERQCQTSEADEIPFLSNSTNTTAAVQTSLGLHVPPYVASEPAPGVSCTSLHPEAFMGSHHTAANFQDQEMLTESDLRLNVTSYGRQSASANSPFDQMTGDLDHQQIPESPSTPWRHQGLSCITGSLRNCTAGNGRPTHPRYNRAAAGKKEIDQELLSPIEGPLAGRLEHISHSTTLGDPLISIPSIDEVLHVCAARAPDFDFLNALLRKGFDVRFRDSKGQTMFHTLAPDLLGVKLLNILRECKATDFNYMIRDINGTTAIHAIINRITNHCVLLELLRILPELEVNLYARNRYGHSAIDAVRRWQQTLQNLPISVDGKVVNANELCQTYAPDRREILPAVKLRLESLSREQYWEANTAMSQVVEGSLTNVRVEDEEGRTPVICFMYMLWPSSESYHRKSFQDVRVMIENCLSRGVDVNEYDADSCTALHHLLGVPGVSDEGKASILRILLKFGANVHLRNGMNRMGNPALHLACQFGLPVCTRLLLVHLRDRPYYDARILGVNALNDKGRSVIAQARCMQADPRWEVQTDLIQRCIDMVMEAGGC